MRLIGAYIDNFGTLSDFTCRFDKGLTCVYSPNGSGKTTLAAFIKAMLYGFPDTRRQSITDNERRRYQPWQGGRYGGSLRFEHGGRDYTVERSFGHRPSEDTFLLRMTDTGALSREFSANLGEELLGIDASGFERTLFLSERNLSPSDDARSISARLTEVSGSDGDIGSFDEAMELLEQRRRFYRKQGGKGEIAELEERLAALNERLRILAVRRDNAELYSNKIAEDGVVLASLKSEKARLLSKRDEGLRQSARLQELARASELKARIARCEYALREHEEFFREGVPTREEIAQAKEAWLTGKAMTRAEDSSRLSQRRAELNQIFDGRDCSELENAELTCMRVDELDMKLGELRRQGASAKGLLTELPSEENIRSIRSLKGTGGGWAAAALGAVIVAVGAALGAIILPYLYLLCAAGAVILAVGALSALGTRARARALCRRLGVKETSAAELKSALSELEAACAKREAELAALREQKAELEHTLYGIIDSFPVTPKGSVTDTVRYIKSEYESFLHISGGADVSAEAEVLMRRGAEFVAKFPVSEGDPFAVIEDRLIKRELELSTLARLKSELESYRAEPLPDGGDMISEDELAARLSENEARVAALTESVAISRREYELAMEECEVIDEVTAERDRIADKLKDAERALELIQRTQQLLREACENMQSKYLGATKSGFTKYEAMLGEGGEFAIDTELRLTKTERGSGKSEECYSRGTRELYSLSLKLSLADALFEGEFPFLIMDDPFLSMDDKRVEAGMALLRRLSESRQIVYFTCSSSRAFS